MATNTKNYQLIKPEQTDPVDIDELNGNFDIIDIQLKKNADALEDKQASLTFDDSPTAGSDNPVKSGGIFSALEEKQDQLAYDDTPTEGSLNPVTSGGVYKALEEKQASVIFDDSPTEGSPNPVRSGGVYIALEGKQDSLTFDGVPIEGSSNPATSGAIYTALEGKQDDLTFDDTPTEGSSNPVTSGGIFTALQTAGGIPDWDQSDKTAADYIKNRPFYRVLVSTESVVNAYAKTRTGYGGDWVHFEGSKISGTIPSPGQECTVTITYRSITISEKIKVVKGTWNNTWKELLIYGEAVRMKVSGSWIYPTASITAFGGMSGNASYFVQINNYEYTAIPEEYLDTSFAAPEFLNEKYVTWQSLKAEDAFILMRKDGAYYQQRLSIMVGRGLDELGFTERVEELEGSVGSQTDVLSSISDLQDKTTSLESENQDQLDLIASLQAQVQSLISRVAYLESLHMDGDVIMTEMGSVLSIDGTGASVDEGELVLTSGNVSVVDGELVYGSSSSNTMSVDEDGTLSLNGSGITTENGDLTINAGNISVSDNSLTIDETSQANVTDGVVSVSDASVDEGGVCDLGENVTVEDGMLTIE